MKKAVFGLQEKRGPWTIRKSEKTRCRDIFTFRQNPIFNPSKLFLTFYKKAYKKFFFSAIKKTHRVPPPRPGGSGGGPPIPGAARN